ncbi:MAG: sulfotransferase family 2 domain-containing protein [Elainella sp.]
MTVELISIHIAKTAGSAFRAVLAQVYGCEQLLLDYPPEEYLPPQPLPKQIRAIHGHVLANKYSDYFPTAKRITWLRHPISRLISDYFFSKVAHDPNNPVHLKLAEENLGLLEFAEQKDIRNMQSYQLAGMELEEFDFVGLQEFYQEDLQDLRQQMGWGQFTVEVRNANPQPSYHHYLYEALADKQLIRELVRLNAEDMALYHQAIALRAERRCESRLLQYTLLGLEQATALTHGLEQERRQWAFWAQHQPRRAVETTIFPVEETELLGCFIDSPARLAPIVEDWLPISGWVIGRVAKPIAVRVLYQSELVLEMPVHQERLDVVAHFPQADMAQFSGFSGRLLIASVPVGTELGLEVGLADGSQVPLGTIAVVKQS